MKIDLHVHTSNSIDSLIRPEDLAAKSEKLGIIPAITDHNSIASNNLFPSIAGEEIKTDRGDLIALFVTDLIPKDTLFEDALDIIREQGAISYLPHMYDSTRHGTVPKENEIAKIDVIEIFNSRTLLDRYNQAALEFAEKHGKPGAVGSDSHFLLEFGSTYNEVPDFDLDDPKQFLKSLKKAKFVKKKAPFYVRGTTTVVKFLKRAFK
ncbi:PHP domain-containing protein [Candidatus Micrarchaeota archaeon]|nr:PHP domain-containing protein [Candidatus Micrarchaeota archaeon]